MEYVSTVLYIIRNQYYCNTRRYLSDIATHITNIKCKSFKAVKRYMNIYGQGAHK